MSQSMSISMDGEVTIARLLSREIPEAGFIDLEQRLTLLKRQARPLKFVLNLEQLAMLGSVGLTHLMLFYKHVREAGGHMALTGLQDHPRSVLEVTALTRVFALYDDVEGAIEGLA